MSGERSAPVAYLDYNASAPVRPEAVEAMLAALSRAGNASSVHAGGRAARRLVDDSRARIAALVGAGAAQVVFTSGGTEANNLALTAARCFLPHRRVLASAIEHDSVRNAATELAGFETIPVTAGGIVDLGALRRLLASDRRPALVAVMLANNETGVVQPVAEVAALAREFGAQLLCDAVQAAGKMPIGFDGLGADLLALSAHKLGGPQGVGALVVREGVPIVPLLRGGSQEQRRRAGTENVPGIAGFAAAAEAAMTELPAAVRLAEWRDELERRVLAIAPDSRIYGGEAPRLANTSCLAMPGVAAETQVMALDLAGVAVSAGAACSSGKVTPSHVLRAMGVAERDAACAIRVSMGWATRRDDIERFVAVWQELYLRTRRHAA